MSLQDEDLLDIYRSAQDEAQHGLPIGPVREVAGAKGVLANASNSSVLMFCFLVDSEEDVIVFVQKAEKLNMEPTRVRRMILHL